MKADVLQVSKSMAENNAVERYDAFENLRSQFDKKSEENPCGKIRRKGRDKKITGENCNSNSSGKCKSSIDSKCRNGGCDKGKGRVNGGTSSIVSLIEKGDLLQQNLASQKTEYASKNLVKGWWKNSDHIKSNHLNSPDFDAIETASVTSCSSAYSSRSGSSFLSPQVGSYTELSDGGSCDTHQEYDLCPVETKGMSKYWSTSATTGEGEARTLVPSNQVRTNTQIWNELIGDWTFEGKVDVASTPTSERKYHVTNEIRLPTPMGSTDNLLDYGSTSSLCSDSSCFSNGPPVSTGKFSWKKRLSTSHLIDLFEPNCGEIDGESTLKPGCNAEVLKWQDGTSAQEDVSHTKESTLKADQDVKSKNDPDNHDEKKATSGTERKVTAIPHETPTEKPCEEQEGEAARAQSDRPNRPKIRSVSDRIKQLTRSQTEPEIKIPPSTSHIRPSKFGEAYKVYRELQTLSESANIGTSPKGRRKIVSVKERSQVFTQN